MMNMLRVIVYTKAVRMKAFINTVLASMRSLYLVIIPIIYPFISIGVH